MCNIEDSKITKKLHKLFKLRDRVGMPGPYDGMYSNRVLFTVGSIYEDGDEFIPIKKASKMYMMNIIKHCNVLLHV